MQGYAWGSKVSGCLPRETSWNTGVLTLTNLAAIPVTNASINPASSVGPAVFAGGWALQQIWCRS